MIGATILSVTLVPVLCSLLIGGRVRGEEHNPVMRSLVWLYRPVLDFALRHRVATLAVAVLVVAGASALVPRIGTEFMPPLNEGDLMFMPVTDPAIGLGQAIEITRKQNAAIQKFPEVASVVAKIARADTSTDPAPVNMTETIVSLKPEREWRPGDDAREAHRRAGSGHHAARRVEHLDAADHQHADDRHPLRGGRSRSPATTSTLCRSGRAHHRRRSGRRSARASGNTRTTCGGHGCETHGEAVPQAERRARLRRLRGDQRPPRTWGFQHT
jgi:multidrug efflux pump subunit AcrB